MPAIMKGPSASGKSYLVESRLASLVRDIGLDNVPDLIGRVQETNSSSLRLRIVDAMTTNETSFFRDTRPFTELKDILVPDLIKYRKEDKQISIWSAASSSGQEPYSIAMALNSSFKVMNGWKLNIIASDISENMLSRARAGRYSQIEINRGLPRDMLGRYFKPEESGWNAPARV